MVGSREALEQFPTELCCQTEETLGRKRIRASRELYSNLKQIDSGTAGIKANVLPVGDDSLATGSLNERTQPA